MNDLEFLARYYQLEQHAQHRDRNAVRRDGVRRSARLLAQHFRASRRHGR